MTLTKIHLFPGERSEPGYCWFSYFPKTIFTGFKISTQCTVYPLWFWVYPMLYTTDNVIQGVRHESTKKRNIDLIVLIKMNIVQEPYWIKVLAIFHCDIYFLLSILGWTANFEIKKWVQNFHSGKTLNFSYRTEQLGDLTLFLRHWHQFVCTKSSLCRDLTFLGWYGDFFDF